MRIFSGRAHPQLGLDICRCLQIDPGLCEVNSFADGEINVHILDDVRGLDVFVVQPTCCPVNDNLMELLVMVDALRRASAGKITAVIPYYGYARQDRKHEGRVPITAKLVANLLTEAGVNRLLCMDLHAQQIQGFFDIPVDHLYARPVIVDYLRQKHFPNPIIVSPDVGSAKMALGFCKALGTSDMAIIEKRRKSGSEIEHGFVIGSIADKDVIIVDDMISTGGTIVTATRQLKEAGAKTVTVACTHGVFVNNALDRLEGSNLDGILSANTLVSKVSKISVAKLIARALREW